MKLPEKPVKIYIILILFVFLLYGNTLRNDYSLDDNLIFLDNPLIEKGISGLPEIFTTKYVSRDDRSYDYRPIVKLSAGIDFFLWKFNPHLSHLVNILLYAFLLIVLFRLLRMVFLHFDTLLMFIILILFAAHPVHTEVVASIKNRDELFSMIFSISAAISFLQWITKGNFRYFITGLLLFFLAMLSKTSALVFVAIIPLLVFYTQTQKSGKPFVIALTLLVTAGLFFVIPQILLEGAGRNPDYFENPLFYEKGLELRLGLAGMTLLHYLALLIFPVKLLYYYGYNTIPLVSVFSLLPILSIIIHVLLLIFGFLMLKKKNPVGLGILYYMLAVSMFSNILMPVVGIVADRFVFNASLGFSIIIGYLIFKGMQIKSPKHLLQKSLKYLSFMFIPMILLYSYRTISRNFDWKNTFTIFETDMPHLENSCKANVVYADALFKQVVRNFNNSSKSSQNEKHTELAIIHLKRSIEIYDQYANAWNTLGAVHFMLKKDFSAAKKYFFKAYSIDSDYAEAAFNIGHTYENMQQPDSALYFYEIAVQIDPRYAMAQNKKILLLFQTGDTLTALKENAELNEMFPESDIAYINLGNYFFLKGDTTEAFIQWEKAIENVPDNPGLLDAIISYYILKDNSEKAEYYRKISINTQKQRKKQNQMPQFY